MSYEQIYRNLLELVLSLIIYIFSYCTETEVDNPEDIFVGYPKEGFHLILNSIEFNKTPGKNKNINTVTCYFRSPSTMSERVL